MDESDAAAATAAASAAAKLKARSGGRRRSCNRCSAKKERCDGQEPCQRCARSGLECLYASCRTLGRPRNASPPVKRRSKAAAAPRTANSAGAAAAASPSRGHGGRGGSAAKKSRGGGSATPASRVTPPGSGSQAPGGFAVRSRKDGSTGGTARARGKSAGGGGAAAAATAAAQASSALKRLSLSPSPATGLTGLVQNRYLTCFVDDFSGFFQVLDEVTIRLGLINLMTGKVDLTELVEASEDPHPVPKRRRNAMGASPPPSSSSPPQASGQQRVHRMTSATVEAAAAEEEEQEVVNAINSSVFSAMSLGAMLLGQPPSHVHIYVAVAEASLRLCGVTEHLAMAVPNEHVAAAALLLAFAANISGRDEYRVHIHLARQCYDRRVRHGLPTPPPIRDSLGYRAIIDALGKPADDRGLRIPSPSKEMRIPPQQQQQQQHPSCPSKESSGGGGGSGSSCSSSDSCRGSSVATSWASEGRDDQPPTGGAGGSSSGVTGTGATASGGGGGGAASREASRGRGDGDKMTEGSAATPPPGLEAARERRRLRKADAMSMVSDIMTMLSRVPWTAHVEEAARRTKRELCELRSLMIAEKALAEERRFASGRTKRRSDGIAVFALASASIGLHCALDEFSELLRLGREVASCIHCCPGLARYQPHAYHAGLVILAAFGKRKEFDDLLRAAPNELRVSASSGQPLTYEAHTDTCSHPVCRKHAKAISEMGRHLRSEIAGRRTTTSSSVTVEELDSGEEGGAAGGGQAELQSMSGKVSIPRAAAGAAASARGSPVPRSTGATQAEKFAALVMRLPTPPESPGHPPSYDDGVPQHGPSSPTASAGARSPEPEVDHAAESAKSANPGEVGEAGTSAGAREHGRWSPEYPSSWSTPLPASEDSSAPGNDVTGLSPTAAALRSASSFDEGHGVVSSSPPLAHLSPMGLGVLSAAADAMVATPAQPATKTRRVQDGSGGSGSGSSRSGRPASQTLKRARVAVSAASSFAAPGEGGGVTSGATNARGGTALETTGRKNGGGNSSAVVSSGSTGVLSAYRPYQPQQQGGSSSALPRGHPVSAALDDPAKTSTMMVTSQRPVPAPVAQAVGVDTSGMQAIQAAAPAGGTLTWRLWGAPRSSLAPPNNGLATPGSGAGLVSPSLQNNPFLGFAGIPRPWQCYGHVPPTAGFPPQGPSALTASLLGGAPVMSSAGPGGTLFPVTAQQGLSPTGVVQVLTGVAPHPPGTQGVSLASSSFTSSGRSTAAATAPGMSSSRPLMTAGEASAAAISLAALAGASPTSHGGSTTSFRKAGIRAPAAAPAAGAPRAAVSEVGGCAGGVEAGGVESHEEEMMALWEIIGTGDSE